MTQGPPLKDAGKLIPEAALADAICHLPPLPSIVRYDDDYAGIVRSIVIQNSKSSWVIKADGRVATINWATFPKTSLLLVQSWLVWHLQIYDATTSIRRAELAQQFRDELPYALNGLCQSPEKAREYWLTSVLSWSPAIHTLSLLKSFVFFMCDTKVGKWTPSHRNFVSQWSYGAAGGNDNLAAVRSGEAFLSSAEEAILIDYYDGVNARIKKSEYAISNKELRAACLLYWVYQHAFRPIQVASLNLPDVQLRAMSNEPPVLHATLHWAKQKESQAQEPMRRSVKRDWSWMMALYYKRRIDTPDVFLTEEDRPHSFFGLPPDGVRAAIRTLYYKLTGIYRTPTAFRHTAAQRLVDAGASQVELAEFLGHKSVDTGLVYYDTSPTQADRVNKALGLSPIYNAVAEVARTKSIDVEALLGLPDAQHIGAAPHGISIAGIGGCDVGQPLCTMNPALSCYTCSKFMPLSDATVHESVRDDLRPVVHLFVQAGRDDASSPAFMQLRRTLDSMELLISELKGASNE